MKEQITAPEKIQLNDEEIANLWDAQFKTLVIRMLTKMVEYGHKIEKKVKATKSEIKENSQGTNSDVLGSLPTFSYFPCYLSANWTLLVLISRWVGLCTF